MRKGTGEKDNKGKMGIITGREGRPILKHTYSLRIFLLNAKIFSNKLGFFNLFI